MNSIELHDPDVLAGLGFREHEEVWHALLEVRERTRREMTRTEPPLDGFEMRAACERYLLLDDLVKRFGRGT